MSEGFLGRWSKRKLEVKEGKEVGAEPMVESVPPPQPSRAGGGSESLSPDHAEQPLAAVPGAEPDLPAPPLGEGGGGGNESEAPAPTLEDVKALTAESDFSRFTGSGVAPDVTNAAMKKLFSDPHYNIMDRLDVYIDDYSKPDPMPESMIRQLASVKFLGLFAREEKAEAEAQAARQARDVANNPTGQTVAQSLGPLPAVPEPTDDHADPDLRLQQDHAAPGEDPGRGAE
jgi:hypothetical protein